MYLYLSGETAGTNRFSNLHTGSMNVSLTFQLQLPKIMLMTQEIVIQILMQATNGLGVILENRYYGESFPFNDSTTDHLAFLTTEQSLSFPFPHETRSAF